MHSPGPWSWDGPQDNIHVVQSNAPHVRVCFLTSNGPTEANARLICEAPAMLSALIDARMMLELTEKNRNPNWDGTATPSSLIGEIRAIMKRIGIKP